MVAQWIAHSSVGPIVIVLFQIMVKFTNVVGFSGQFRLNWVPGKCPGTVKMADAILTTSPIECWLLYINMDGSTIYHKNAWRFGKGPLPLKIFFLCIVFAFLKKLVCSIVFAFLKIVLLYCFIELCKHRTSDTVMYFTYFTSSISTAEVYFDPVFWDIYNTVRP